MKLTFYGHACFLLQLNNAKILFDPAMTMLQTPGVEATKMEADFLLISHGHGDHIADAADIAKRTQATVVSNYEITTWLNNQGIDKTQPLNHGGKWDFEFGSVKYVNAIHSSSLPDGSNGGNPGGFIIKSEEGEVYYAGDTALTVDMKLIGDYHSLRAALLPIGDCFTMGIEDAVIASDFINCNKIIGMHYDTFLPITIDHNEAKTKFAKAGKELILMDINQTIEI